MAGIVEADEQRIAAVAGGDPDSNRDTTMFRTPVETL
jgi:hypothetical protein